MTCVSDGKVTVCHGPRMVEVKRVPDGEERWCFRCRKRSLFEFVVDAPTEISYYGPNPRIECVGGHHEDGDMFPGRFREWEG